MGLYDILPVETEYRGSKFRSRLEARWAVFFDRMGIEWKYEPETFNMGEVVYCPDFWLPDLTAFAEVKPDWEHVTKDTMTQCVALAKATERPVLILDGLPDFRGYRICTALGLYAGAHACITLDKLYGDMNDCILALGENLTYKEAVNAARGHRFEPPN